LQNTVFEELLMQGEHIVDGKIKTGLSIISLYGDKKPKRATRRY
jgi:hypothetical protein